MILFINTSQTNLIQLKLFDKDEVVNQIESREEFKHSELLLGLIDKLISAKGGPAYGGKSIKFIAIVSGPGAFSALRLGVATANIMAWALKIPIIEMSVDEVMSDDVLILRINKKIKGLKDWRIGDFVPIVPKYGKEPNITKKNHRYFG